MAETCLLYTSVRRDTREKQFVKFEDLATAIPAAMEALAKDLYDLSLIHIYRPPEDLQPAG